MNTEHMLPKRKRLRWEHFNYSAPGAYFVTICVNDKKPILSEIIKPTFDPQFAENCTPPLGDGAPTSHYPQFVENRTSSVGDGAPTSHYPQFVENRTSSVGDGALDVPQIRLTPIGKIVEKHLLSSEKTPGVKIDRYVIMPDHVHAIILLTRPENASSGTSKAPSPTDVRQKDASSPTNKMLPHIVSTFKRFCNREVGGNIFQRGYIEHVIRDRADYETRTKYILENPMRRYYKNTES